MKKHYFTFVSFLFICLIANSQTTITWSAPMSVSMSSYGNNYPRVVMDASGNPVVSWGRGSDQSLFVSKWSGSSFATPVKVTPTGFTVASATWMGPGLASKGDTIYTVMKETPEMYDSNHVYIARSFDGGTTFSTPMQVDNIADSISRFPVVTTNASGNPIVGFMKFDASFGNARWAVSKSTDYGSTFSTDRKASGWSGMGAQVCDCCPGSIVCSGNNVDMLYRDNLSNIRDMWAGLSTNGGNSFTQGIGFDQGNWLLMMCPSSGPDGEIIGDTLYTTYMSAASGNELISFNKTSLSSPVSSPGKEITGTYAALTLQNYPRMASAGTALAIVWKQTVGGTEQLALRFTNNVVAGIPFSVDTLVATNNIINTDVALADGKIVIVWQDNATGTVKYRIGTFVSTAGIETNDLKNSFSVYPNPCTTNLTLVTNKAFTGKVSVEIIDITGRFITKQEYSFSDRLTINTSGIAKGAYLIKISGENIQSVQHFVKN